MIHLYAEHLLNIRTLSLQAVLSTVSNKETKATLSADGSILTIAHEGETARVTLPINLSPNRPSNVILTIPAVPSRELHFRVQLEAKENAVNGVLSNGDVADGGNVVPWTASSLTDETVISCMSCNATVLERGRIRTWKDLPSEGWAEMMEFWHCHKPNEPHSHGLEGSTKGYTANSQLALEGGVGLVDVASFLFMGSDCTNTTISTISDSDESIICASCSTPIGEVEHSTQGYRLRKHRLSLSNSPESSFSSYSTEKWFACLLLCAMENQGVQKFIIRNTAAKTTKSIKLWIFTPNLSISTSVRESPEPIRVMKVHWQDCEVPADDEGKLNGSALSEGEISLSEEDVGLLKNLLVRGGELLPENARKFMDWDVGLLQRFTAGDLEQKAVPIR